MTMLFTLAFVSLTVQDKSKEWPCHLKPLKSQRSEQKRLHQRSGNTASADNTEGKLDQLLADAAPRVMA